MAHICDLHVSGRFIVLLYYNYITIVCFLSIIFETRFLNDANIVETGMMYHVSID